MARTEQEVEDDLYEQIVLAINQEGKTGTETRLDGRRPGASALIRDLFLEWIGDRTAHQILLMKLIADALGGNAVAASGKAQTLVSDFARHQAHDAAAEIARQEEEDEATRWCDNSADIDDDWMRGMRRCA